MPSDCHELIYLQLVDMPRIIFFHSIIQCEQEEAFNKYCIYQLKTLKFLIVTIRVFSFIIT